MILNDQVILLVEDNPDDVELTLRAFKKSNIFNEVVGEVPSKEIETAKLEGAGMPLIELLVHSGLCPSKGQARKDLEGGGIYLNNTREGDIHRGATGKDLLFGKHLLLRKGKRNYVVVTAKG